jgi:spermidine synthase
MVSLAYAAPIKNWLQTILGAGMTQALMAEAALATAAFLLPSLVMGALFSHLSTSARSSGISFGQALGANTLGAAVAPAIFGVVLVPEVGVKVALLILIAGYLALVSRSAWRNPIQWSTAAVALAFAIWLPRLVIVDIPPGGRLLNYQEGAMSAVSIVEDSNGVATLHIDNRQQEGSSATLFADARQALLPMLLHPAPHRALFLGLGTGVTASTAAMDAKLEVDAVELLPEVIRASSYFTRPLDDGAPSSRLHFMVADARRFVRASDQRYDLIVADNFHPARSGSGSLYTVEHFQAVRARLADDGLFCQWLPLHQLDLETLRSIVRSFLSAYPHGVALLATNSLETPVVGLIGGASDEQRFDVDRLRSRLANIAMKRAPPEFGVVDDFALLGNFIAGPQALTRFAGAAPLNTDDRPVVAYRAPRITYAPDSSPRDRLIALLREVDASPSELLSGSRPPDFDARLAAYWNARNRFIEVGRDVRPTADAEQMLAQVRAPLLQVLHISPDFRPAYDPLVRMAAALVSADPTGARTLLLELEQAQPARAEAAAVLAEMNR